MIKIIDSETGKSIIEGVEELRGVALIGTPARSKEETKPNKIEVCSVLAGEFTISSLLEMDKTVPRLRQQITEAFASFMNEQAKDNTSKKEKEKAIEFLGELVELMKLLEED